MVENGVGGRLEKGLSVLGVGGSDLGIGDGLKGGFVGG